MIKIKIAIAIFVISIVGIIVNSVGLAIPNAQSTSDEGDNNTQSFDDGNNAQTSDDSSNARKSDDSSNAQKSGNGNDAKSTSDDGDNVLSFNQDLLPDLSPSNQKIIDKTPSGTLNQSGNLQNPSIQTELNQSLPYSHKDVQLQQSKKPPSAEDCVLANDSKSANCPTMEAYDAPANCNKLLELLLLQKVLIIRL